MGPSLDIPKGTSFFRDQLLRLRPCDVCGVVCVCVVSCPQLPASPRVRLTANGFWVMGPSHRTVSLTQSKQCCCWSVSTCCIASLVQAQGADNKEVGSCLPVTSCLMPLAASWLRFRRRWWMLALADWLTYWHEESGGSLSRSDNRGRGGELLHGP